MNTTDLNKLGLAGSTAISGSAGVPARQRRLPACWQLIIAPPGGAPNRPAAEQRLTGDASSIVRVDTPQAAAVGHHLPLTWSQEIGWHREGHVPSAAAELAPRSTSVTAPAEDSQQLMNSQATELLTEAAHDIRSPIATAQQILGFVAERWRSGQASAAQDIESLESASLRLQQAARWAERILVERQLGQRQLLASYRQRFFPDHWLPSVEPLLRAAAARRQVHLTWSGWDRPLPRLYLDADHLSRVVLNLVTNAIDASLPGAVVQVRALSRNQQAPELLISIEDQGTGLATRWREHINATAGGSHSASVGRGAASDPGGRGLKTITALVNAMGGTLLAAANEPSGTRMQLSLPIDSPFSLLRSWLQQQAGLAARGEAFRLQVHALRSYHLPTLGVDQQLQRAALEGDFVYRVADDRWLWFALQTERAQGLPPSAAATDQRLAQLADRLAQAGGRTAKTAACRVQCVYQLDHLALERMQGAHPAAHRLTQLTDVLVGRLRQLIVGHVPPLDELGEASTAAFARVRLEHAREQIAALPTRQLPANRLPHAVAIARAATAERSLQAGHTPPSAAAESAKLSIEEMARQWRAIQSKLENLRQRMTSATQTV